MMTVSIIVSINIYINRFDQYFSHAHFNCLFVRPT